MYQPTVFVNLADPSASQALAQRLSSLAAVVWATPAEMPQGMRIDLLVTDSADIAAGHGYSAAATGETFSTTQWHPPGPGVIVLGTDANVAADAVLPIDVTDRELLSTCRLVLGLALWRRAALEMTTRGREFERLALIDPLAGVANRRAWDQQLPPLLEAAQAAGRAVCLALFDVDQFKPINDSLGHDIGDRVLAAVGQEFSQALRGTDLAARLGGDEFGALLIGDFNAEQTLRLVERIRTRLGNAVIQATGHTITLSAGYALVTLADAAGGSALDALALFARADLALRRAKQAGRARTECET